MPLFGNKKDKIVDLPEVVDFSNDTWSYKGNPPSYQIQSDGFTYDISDADGNDKNAISLGIAGMIVIVLNAKSPKIKEDEILPLFGKVIKTRNWHAMTVKEGNFLVQTAIKKLTNSATSGDVFDLASYAPLEVKRVLLKTLFTLSRMQLPPECREEAEHRIIDDIVPDIFANPEYELALLTGLIIKSDEKPEPVSTHIETAPIIDGDLPRSDYASDASSEPVSAYSSSEPEPDSAYAELQKIYGRRVDTPQIQAIHQAAVQNAAAQAPVNEERSQNAPQMNQQPQQGESGNSENIQGNAAFQQNNPFNSTNQMQVPQPPAPNFGGPQPNNPFAVNQGQMNYRQPQNIPQPPMPGYNMQPNMQQPNAPYGWNPAQGNPQMMNMNPGMPQNNPYGGNFQGYPQQMRQPVQQNQTAPQQAVPNGNTLNSPQPQFPPIGWQQNYQQNQNYPVNPQNPNAPQMQGMGNPQQNPAWQNQGYPQQPPQPQQQNSQNS